MPVQRTCLPTRPTSGRLPDVSRVQGLYAELTNLRDALACGEVHDVQAASRLSTLLATLPSTATNPATPVPTTVCAPAVPTPVKPPRYNFAGYCGVCGHLGCDSARCIQIWANTGWAVCTDCHGLGDDNAGTRCPTCLNGVIEVGPHHSGLVAR